MARSSLPLGGLLLLLLLLSAAASSFREAPAFLNGRSCPPPAANSTIHIAMTLDANYLRGTIAAVFSILQHSTCPENVVFHFVSATHEPQILSTIAMTLDANYLRGTIAAVFSILQHSTCPENVVFHFVSATHEPQILSTIASTFPYLNLKVYTFDAARVRRLISKSIRLALDQPLNYARIYLAAILPYDVKRLIYLDSDLVMVDDVGKLWRSDLNNRVVAAPEYCHANFTCYFTDEFWSDPELAAAFDGRRPCYFNTGVMVMDLEKWREKNYTQRMEDWMAVQKQRRIYQLGSLPPFLLVLAGEIEPVDHRWNQHGLGGDNVEGRCRDLHPGPISLLHWSGKGKPWLRLDSKKPCNVDLLWAPYDLYRSINHAFED